MSLATLAPDTGKADRRAYWRSYYLANREKKLAAANARNRARNNATSGTSTAIRTDTCGTRPKRAGQPRFYSERMAPNEASR